MEAQNRNLAEQLNSTKQRHEAQLQALMDEVAKLRQQVGSAKSPENAATVDSPGEGSNPRRVSPDATRSPGPGEGTDAGGASGTPGGRRSPTPGSGISGSTAQKKTPLTANFGPGFELASDNEEFQLQFHQETQFDARSFDPNGDEFARSGFVFPRVREFFNGRITKPIEYAVSLNRGFSGLDILDGFVNFHYDDRFQLKIGRFMTPFNYEQFAVQNMWLFTPERSLFTANLGLNRQLGIQLWGNVFDKRLDYAVGVFDGPRNSFEDYNEAKDVMAYLNVHPFEAEDNHGPLRALNLGGSFIYGEEDNPLTPRTFRTASNASNASAADLFSPPFLILDADARERGQRAFWSAHVAYFYKRLSFLTDYNGGVLRYVTSQKAPVSADIPVSGASIALGYFLTGESQERRTSVEPIRPFSLLPGKLGPGAWELILRYSTLEFDRDVFTAKLSDPALWSNRVWSSTLGMNWYLNRYIKFYFDWQHTEFGDPVIYRRPNMKQLTNELFWMRMQLYF